MKFSPIVRIVNISKHFGGVRALEKVNLEIYPREIIGLVGDNGAGKSTLMKILSGVYSPDEGEIFFKGEKVTFFNPIHAKEMGIEMVYQDLALCDNLNVYENIFLGREPVKKFLGNLVRIIDTKTMEKKSMRVLEELKIGISNMKTKVSNFSGGQRKAVAIGRALLHRAKLLIMDEPTAALAVKEIGKVLQLIKQLRERGVSVIFISHNLQEIFATVDRIVVLRAGKLAGVKLTKETNMEEIVSLMVGGKVLSKKQ